MNKDSKIFVAGHRGLVGSAVVRRLKANGYTNILTATREELDLTDPVRVRWFFSAHEPEYVFLCAAKVGGIAAHAACPVGFLQQNLDIQRNVMQEAVRYKTKKLLFLGSSCIYPRDCPQPIKEEYLLTGPLEKTNEAYALAKIAGIKLAQYYRDQFGSNFVCAMPCNVFGPHDDFHPETAHVVPGMLARMHEAKQAGVPTFYVWGNPQTMREHIFSEDLADALIAVMNQYNDREPINTGSGFECTMADLAGWVSTVVGFEGGISFDSNRPAGTPRKILDNSKLRTFWSPSWCFLRRLRETYKAFQNGEGRVRLV